MISFAIDIFNLIALRAAESGFDPAVKDQEVKTGWMLDELALFGIDPEYKDPERAPDVTSWAQSVGFPHGSRAEKALHEFCNLPYWARAWIFQECVISKKAVLFHTCRTIELSKLLFVANWTDAVRRQPKPEDINVLLWRIITGDSTFNHIHRIRCTRDSININQTFQA